jgi:hypothetical protein
MRHARICAVAISTVVAMASGKNPIKIFIFICLFQEPPIIDMISPAAGHTFSLDEKGTMIKNKF